MSIASITETVGRIRNSATQFFGFGVDTAKIESPQRRKLSDEEQQALVLTNARIDKMLKEVRTDNALWEPIYRDGLNYVYDSQLIDQRREGGWQRIQINKIFPSLAQEQALDAQRRPAIRCEAGDAEAQAAEIWSGALNYVLTERLKMPFFGMRGCIDLKTHGHKIAKIFWDKESEWSEDERRWIGDVDVTLMKHEYYGRDTLSEDTVRRPRVEMCYRMVDVEQAIARWPEHRAGIEEAARQTPEQGRAYMVSEGRGDDSDAPSPFALKLGETAQPDEPGNRDGRLVRALLRTYDVPLPQRPKGEKGELINAVVPLLEIWFEDYERETVEVKEPVPVEDLLADGRVVQDVDPKDKLKHNYLVVDGKRELLTGKNYPTNDSSYVRPKYPNGHFIQRFGRDVIVTNKAWDEKYWPFAVGVNMVLPHTWRGLNGVEMVRETQDRLNELGAHFENFMRNFSDPLWLVEVGALQKCPDNNPNALPNFIANRNGTVISVNPGKLKSVERVGPPSMSEGLMQMYRTFEEQAADIIGQQNISLGKKTKNTTATEAIRMEQAARMRTSLQGKLEDIWYLEVARRVLSLLQKYSTPDRIAEMASAGTGRTYTMEQVRMDAKLRLKVEVVTDFAFDKEREQKNAEAVLKAIGTPALPQFLKAFDAKNPEELLRQAPIYMAVVKIANAKSPDEIQSAVNELIQGMSAGKPATQGEAAA